jgi:hypothetical protein
MATTLSSGFAQRMLVKWLIELMNATRRRDPFRSSRVMRKPFVAFTASLRIIFASRSYISARKRNFLCAVDGIGGGSDIAVL